MDYKYIYNEEGKKEAVIIPIREWENMQKILGDKEEKKGRRKPGLASMVGIGKGDFKSVKEVDEFLNKLRDEWD